MSRGSVGLGPWGDWNSGSVFMAKKQAIQGERGLLMLKELKGKGFL